jgi:hypothetical protein
VRGAPFALALAALLSAGCVTVRWERLHHNEAATAAEIAAVVPGSMDLARALELLGAPLFVWELPHGDFALAYGWTQDLALGATITLPTSRALSPSYSYDSLDGRIYGLVLLFDHETRLELVREGYLREIAAELLRARPADVDDLGPQLSASPP